MVGAKRGLVMGTAAYVVYVGAFVFPSYATVPIIALIAGLFGALLWTVGFSFDGPACVHFLRVSAAGVCSSLNHESRH